NFLGVIFESENDGNGIQKILQELHGYVPFIGDGEERRYSSQAIVGDQLTVERAVNAHMTLINGFTPEERLDGIHCEIADWVAGNKALGIAFAHFYNPTSAGDKCTLYSDRNLINRRSVKSDVDAAVNLSRRFFILELEARIVAARMKELGIKELEEMSQCVPHQFESWTKAKKKEYLEELAATIVDKYILDKAKHKKIALATSQLEEKQFQSLKDMTSSCRYKCRFPGCNKTFRSDGKWRHTHEQSHNPPVNIEEQPLLTEIHEDVTVDDMYNYQTSLLEYGIVILNFFDAISEGDGARASKRLLSLLSYAAFVSMLFGFSGGQKLENFVEERKILKCCLLEKLHSVELKEKGKTPSPKRKTSGFTQTTPRKNIEPDNPPGTVLMLLQRSSELFNKERTSNAEHKSGRRWKSRPLRNRVRIQENTFSLISRRLHRGSKEDFLAGLSCSVVADHEKTLIPESKEWNGKFSIQDMIDLTKLIHSSNEETVYDILTSKHAAERHYIAAEEILQVEDNSSASAAINYVRRKSPGLISTSYAVDTLKSKLKKSARQY
ncbi:Hypothetical predicted protein, partial [Paramuricea clavata]